MYQGFYLESIGALFLPSSPRRSLVIRLLARFPIITAIIEAHKHLCFWALTVNQINVDLIAVVDAKRTFEDLTESPAR